MNYRKTIEFVKKARLFVMCIAVVLCSARMLASFNDRRCAHRDSQQRLTPCPVTFIHPEWRDDLAGKRRHRDSNSRLA